MNAKATAPTNDFDAAAAAHAKVKAAIQALRAEYDANEAGIERTAAELDRQLAICLPPDEMKQAVIEILGANAKRFERDIRASFCDFVRHKQASNIPPASVNKPMSYADIESIIAGKYSQYEFTNLLKAGKTPHVFDAPLFMFFETAIAERMLAILAEIFPDEMGYSSIAQNDIGCGLEERRALVTKLNADLDELHARRTDLAGKLAGLGFRVPVVATGKP